MQSPESKRSLSAARAVVLAASLFTSLGAGGCGAGAYVWVDQLGAAGSAAAPESVYLIAAGDQLNIRVYDQDAISTHSRVGPDGTIAIPLIGEIMAQGQRPAALARQIEARLKPFIVAPSVAITVEEAQSVKISVVGEVAHSGVFVINPGAGVVQALALAGGLTEFAARDSIYVLRAHAAKGPLRIRLTYADLTRGVGRAPAFPLQAGDTVVAE